MLKKFHSKSLYTLIATLFVLSQLVVVFGVQSYSARAEEQPVSPTGAAEAGMTLYLPQIMNRSPNQSIFGASFDANDQAALKQMKSAESNWVRRGGLYWSKIEANQGERNWAAVSSLESEMIKASQQGMKYILIVQSTPAWAQLKPGYSCGPIAQTYFDEFAQFMYEVVQRYSGAPYNVKYFELWNEPDIDPSLAATPDSEFGCWGNKDDAYYGGEYYADMLQVVYPEIKRANPTVQVLNGGLVMDCDPRNPGICVAASNYNGNIPKFLEGILRHHGANDGANYLDMVNFHAYDYYMHPNNYSNASWSSGSNDKTTESNGNLVRPGPSLIYKARYIKELLAKYGVGDKPLINSELAILCRNGQESGGVNCEPEPTSAYEQTKANYVTQSFAGALAEGIDANIWYNVLGWFNSSLLYPENYQPREAYKAFTVAETKLRDATFSQQLNNLGSDVMGYEFVRQTRRVWVIWSGNEANDSVNLGGTPVAITDALGNKLSPSNVVEVGQRPLFIEW